MLAGVLGAGQLAILKGGGVRTAGLHPCGQLLDTTLVQAWSSPVLVERVLGQDQQEAAFGRPGEPGDATRIEALARRLVNLYESLLDWAASMRATTVPGDYDELLEATVGLANGSIASFRDFFESVPDQISRLPELAAAETPDTPITMSLILKLDVDPADEERHARALETGARALTGAHVARLGREGGRASPRRDPLPFLHMSAFTFNVVFEDAGDGWVYAHVQELPEVHTQGDGLDQARIMVREAIQLVLEDRRERGEAIPATGWALVEPVEIAA